MGGSGAGGWEMMEDEEELAELEGVASRQSGPGEMGQFLEQMEIDTSQWEAVPPPRRHRCPLCVVLLSLAVVGLTVGLVLSLVRRDSADHSIADKGTMPPWILRQLPPSDTPHGALEAVVDGMVYAVCEDGWGDAETLVACRHLGFPTAYNSIARVASRHPMLDDVVCRGREDSLFSCIYSTASDCGSEQGVAVWCSEWDDGDRCTGAAGDMVPLYLSNTSVVMAPTCLVAGDERITIAAPALNKTHRVTTALRPGQLLVVTVADLQLPVVIYLNSNAVATVGGEESARPYYDACWPHPLGPPLTGLLGTAVLKYTGSRVGTPRQLRGWICNGADWEWSVGEGGTTRYGLEVLREVPPPTPVPPTPAPPFLCGEGWGYHPGMFLGGYALSDSREFPLPEAQALCLEYGDGCRGVTCTSYHSCSVRAGTPYLSPSASEASCTAPLRSLAPTDCVGSRRLASCDGDSRMPLSDRNCSAPVGNSSGFCQCGSGRHIRYACPGSTVSEERTCSELCSTPDEDECYATGSAVCGSEYRCVDPDPHPGRKGGVACLCTGGLLGMGIDGPPAMCRNPFRAVEGDMCPMALHRVQESCTNAVSSFNMSIADTADEDPAGCTFDVRDSVALPVGPSPRNVTTFCTTHELPGGFTPPPTADYLPSDHVQAEAVRGLLRRVVGKKASDYIVTVQSALDDSCELRVSGEVIEVKGTSGVAAAVCIRDHLENPTTTSVARKARVLYRYMYNTVTFGYTTPYWSWERWEREIDRLALHGVNLPLAFNGQEFLWHKLYSELGLSDEEIYAHFAGLAFLPWERMGNIEGWGGPLSPSLVRRRHELQLKILNRQREFGMYSVLPAFAGHVPKGLQRVFPNASYVESTPWNGFESTLLLQPDDPLFVEVGGRFASLQKAAYGTVSHFYNGDMFNEMHPSNANRDYLRVAGAAILDGIHGGDPHGKWVMQGWMFADPPPVGWWAPQDIEAYLSAVPSSDLLVLDLTSETRPVFQSTSYYFHHSFIWCFLHNFGGRPGMYGDWRTAAFEPYRVQGGLGSTMVGVGLTMEAMEQNPMIYDLVLDGAWEGGALSQSNQSTIDPWLVQWVNVRYEGGASPGAVQAWRILLQLQYTGRPMPADWNLFKRPTLYASCTCSFCTYAVPSKLVEAWELLLGAPIDVTGYVEDVVSLSSLVLQTLFCAHLQTAVAGFDKYRAGVRGDEVTTAILGELEVMEGILETLDWVLSGDLRKVLWCTLHDAEQWGETDAEKERLRFGVRNILTLWGPDPESRLLDYGRRAWSGLIETYYLPRWRIFREAVTGYFNSSEDVPMAIPDVVHYERYWGMNGGRAAGVCGRNGDWSVESVHSRITALLSAV